MAETKNITFPRGSATLLRFFNTPAGELPGSTVHFTVARNPDSKVKIIGPKTCTVPDEAGAFTCELTSSETNVKAGNYFWDARVVDAGVEMLLGSGRCVVTGIAELPDAES